MNHLAVQVYIRFQSHDLQVRKNSCLLRNAGLFIDLNSLSTQNKLYSATLSNVPYLKILFKIVKKLTLKFCFTSSYTIHSHFHTHCSASVCLIAMFIHNTHVHVCLYVYLYGRLWLYYRCIKLVNETYFTIIFQ